MSGISLGSNISALTAQRLLGRSTEALATSSERLSSGLRINRASDDAAGLSISSALNVSARIFSQGVRNLNDGMSALSIAEGAANELSGILIRIKELATQSANGSYSAAQRRPLDTEAQALRAEFNRIIKTTKFNGITLLDGANGSLQVQAGGNSIQGNELNIGILPVAYAGDGTFKAGISLGTGGTPYSLVASDLNGDGFADLVTADSADDTISVHLGNGDGTFEARITYVTGDDPREIVSSDLNGDGVVDLITGDRTGNRVDVLLGNGDGSFKARLSFAASSPSSIVIDDINHDGTLDIVTADFGPNTVSIQFGNGDGTFKAKVSYGTVAGSPWHIDAGDFNQDGNTDIVLGTSGGGGPMHIFLGNSNGTFLAPRSISGSGERRNPIVDDFNFDGIPDIAVGAVGTSNVSIYIGIGDGTFKSAVSYVAGNTQYGLETGDFNGDGITDLLVSTNNVSSVSVLLGNIDGTFNLNKTYAVAAVPFGGAVADFNEDGVLDIATSSDASPTISVLIGNGEAKLQGFSLLTRNGALATIDQMDTAMGTLATRVGQIGAQQSRLQIASRNLLQSRENYKAAEARITNVDVAEESAALIRTQILQQAGVSILAQASQVPSLALRLLQ